jgi:hypothetical protein
VSFPPSSLPWLLAIFISDDISFPILLLAGSFQRLKGALPWPVFRRSVLLFIIAHDASILWYLITINMMEKIMPAAGAYDL